MNTLALYRGLAANNAWSNLRLHRACAQLSRAEYEAARTSFFPSIPETLNHILTVDWFYLDALERGGKGRSLFADRMPFRGFPEVEALAAAQRASDMKLVAFADRLTEADLATKIDIARADHTQRETVADTLLHLSTHQIHHRGQVHAMLAGTSVKPPPLDEYFMSEELPLREAELRELGLPIR
ncbi:DinB family protein [Pendulispora brunnea]|uniref:DinB family protein n=1 Tax=Pendulispora brunnea TaxID=2905690 RepID=A0ABZ2KNR2_9BACT